MTASLRLYALSLLSFLALDSIWLGIIAPGFYRQHIGHLLADQPNWYAAALFYLIYIGGLVYFAVLPGAQGNSPRIGALRGAIYGLVTYATFDLTSHAMFRDWPAIVTAVDLLWGTALSAGASALAIGVHRRLGR
ncbi:MAG: DUF2177 family protein [Holophaga sp.]|nr:DUF2177 family protein [Holophaga sp.]